MPGSSRTNSRMEFRCAEQRIYPPTRRVLNANVRALLSRSKRRLLVTTTVTSRAEKCGMSRNDHGTVSCLAPICDDFSILDGSSDSNRGAHRRPILQDLMDSSARNLGTIFRLSTCQSQKVYERTLVSRKQIASLAGYHSYHSDPHYNMSRQFRHSPSRPITGGGRLILVRSGPPNLHV